MKTMDHNFKHFKPMDTDLGEPSLSQECSQEITSVGEQNGEKDFQPRPNKKLNGAQKKRFKWLLQQGYSPEIARELSVKPMPQRGQPRPGMAAVPDTQRSYWIKQPAPHRMNQNPKHIAFTKKKTNFGKLKKRQMEQNSPKIGKKTFPNENEMSEALTEQCILQDPFKKPIEARLAVLHADYPDILLNDFLINAIKEAILDQIREIKDESVRPIFHGVVKRTGFVVFRCQNLETAMWLKSKQDCLKPWEGATLKMMVESDVSPANIATANFPQSENDDNDKILQFVQLQNEGIKAKGWKVLLRSEHSQSSELTFKIDAATVAELEKSSARSMYINYKFGKIHLMMKQ